MSRHVVATLGIVTIPTTALSRSSIGHCIFWYKTIKSVGHVLSDLAVPIFIHSQRTASVLHEKVQQATLDVLDCWHGRDNILGDQMRAATEKRKGEKRLGIERSGHVSRSVEGQEYRTNEGHNEQKEAPSSNIKI